jgi:hypothetical protein
MSQLLEAFQAGVGAVLSSSQARHEWQGSGAVKIFASSAHGYDVRLVCESYGVYPYAGDWHGAPWDAAAWPPARLKQSVQEFLLSVLSPSGELTVHRSNSRPYKWVLHYSFEGQWTFEETGLMFFNWFGRRSTETLRNDWLSANHPLS